MPEPRFSILIPTRQRHRTLPYALKSVVAQPYTDYEVVVMDNCSSPETAAVVRRFASESSNVRYHRSDRVLAMKDNWETGLEHCRGEFIFVMGDDDALMPDGLVLADQLLSHLPYDLLHWDKFGYWWDDAIDEKVCGRLFVHTGHDVQLLECNQALADFYDFKTGYTVLPCIYSSFVRRPVIERVKSLTGGRYFAAGSPDVYTGIANAFVTPQAAYARRALSLSGNSGNSTGSAHFFRSKGTARCAEYWRDEGITRTKALHPSLIDSCNLEVGIADTMIRAKELLFPNDSRFQVRMAHVLGSMVGAVNRDPDAYDDNVADIHALARKYGFDPARITIPPRQPRPAGYLQGPVPRPESSPELSNGGSQLLAVNCRQAQISDVFQASRLAQAMLPVVSYLAT